MRGFEMLIKIISFMLLILYVKSGNNLEINIIYWLLKLAKFEELLNPIISIRLKYIKYNLRIIYY